MNNATLAPPGRISELERSDWKYYLTWRVTDRTTCHQSTYKTVNLFWYNDDNSHSSSGSIGRSQMDALVSFIIDNFCIKADSRLDIGISWNFDRSNWSWIHHWRTIFRKWNSLKMLLLKVSRFSVNSFEVEIHSGIFFLRLRYFCVLLRWVWPHLNITIITTDLGEVTSMGAASTITTGVVTEVITEVVTEGDTAGMTITVMVATTTSVSVDSDFDSTPGELSPWQKANHSFQQHLTHFQNLIKRRVELLVI